MGYLTKNYFFEFFSLTLPFPQVALTGNSICLIFHEQCLQLNQIQRNFLMVICINFLGESLSEIMRNVFVLTLFRSVFFFLIFDFSQFRLFIDFFLIKNRDLFHMIEMQESTTRKSLQQQRSYSTKLSLNSQTLSLRFPSLSSPPLQPLSLLSL